MADDPLVAWTRELHARLGRDWLPPTELARSAWCGEESAMQAAWQAYPGIRTQRGAETEAAGWEALQWAASAGQSRITRILADHLTQSMQGIAAHDRSQSIRAEANSQPAPHFRWVTDRPCDVPWAQGLYPVHLAVASAVARHGEDDESDKENEDDDEGVGALTSLLTRGADPDRIDERFQATPLQWAQRLQKPKAAALIETALEWLPALRAVRQGDVDALEAWLAAHPDQVDRRLGDNPRTLLLYATDWPGGWPRVEETIERLVHAGADLEARFEGPGVPQSETALHWAASSQDMPALRALIRAGASLDATGGCIADGTPLMLAVCFQHAEAARALIEAGASYALYHVAAVGDLARMDEFFDEQGHYRCAQQPMPYWREDPSAQQILNSALWFAVSGDREEAALRLLAKGAQPDVVGPRDRSPRALAQELGRAWGAERFG